MTARRTTAATLVAATVAVAASSCATRTNAVPGSMPAPTAAPTTATQAACPEPGVVMSIGNVDAAMGLRALTVSMTNCGEQAFTVNGYPVVRVLDDDRKPLDVQVALGTKAITADPALATDPEPVTLAPGQTANAVVVWRNLVTDPTVVATTGTYLEVAPVTGAPAQTVTPHGGVDLGNTGRLGVGPWKVAAAQ